jgi:SAM-dependent methyltransferase
LGSLVIAGSEDPHDQFPAWFFDRTDPSDDAGFYRPDRFVAHIDDRAIAAVAGLYRRLGLTGAVLDLCSSWISHFADPPSELVALGMNANELAANPMATSWVQHDLNRVPRLPFEDDRFDAAVCCVSIDYLVRPISVMQEVARVVKAGGLFVCTFSNRCFPTKAIHGWLRTDDRGRVALVSRYFELAGGYEPAVAALCTEPGRGDPLYGVWAQVTQTEG